MKNIINIDAAGNQLASSVNDGTNTLFINGNQVASNNWVGSGSYTTTVNGKTLTIAKVADLTGNIIIQKTGNYTYKLAKAIQGFYVYQDENGNINVAGNLTINGQILFDTGLTDIRGLYTDGEYRDILQAPNNNNNVVLGHGGYKDEIGATNIYGNAVNIIAKDNITIGGVVMNPQSTITNIPSIITVNSDNANITTANFTQWGEIAQLYLQWTNKNAISVPANGNIGNLNIGTLVAGKRPKILSSAMSSGDNAGASWYNIGTSGAIGLGAVEGTGTARTIAAGTTFNLYSTFILP